MWLQTPDVKLDSNIKSVNTRGRLLRGRIFTEWRTRRRTRVVCLEPGGAVERCRGREGSWVRKMRKKTKKGESAKGDTEECLEKQEKKIKPGRNTILESAGESWRVLETPDTERAQRAALIQVISKRCIQRPESVGMSYILWPNSRKRTLPSPNTSRGDHGDSPSPKCIVFLFFYGRQEVPAAKNKRRGNPSAAEFSPTSRASQSVTAVQYKTTHREKDVSVWYKYCVGLQSERESQSKMREKKMDWKYTTWRTEFHYFLTSSQGLKEGSSWAASGPRPGSLGPLR